MSAIDVGAPTFTSRLGQAITGTNLSTAMRLYFWDDNFGGIADEDGQIYFITPSGIHNQSGVQIASPGIDTGHSYLNLHLLNPIGYNNQIITQVLADLLREQLHVGQGAVRLSPSGDGGTSDWVAFGLKYAQINEPMTAPNLGNSMHVASANKSQNLLFPSLPANATRIPEAIVAFFGAMTKGPSGSDEGLGFGFQLQHASLGNLSRKLIADMYANGQIDARRVKLERLGSLGLTKSQFDAAWLNVTSERGLAGPSPNPDWKVYCLEMVVYYEINEPAYEVVDLAAHAALDSQFAAHPLANNGPWNLDCDIIDTTGYSAMLDILAHAPQLFYYVDYRGQLKPGVVGAYADVANPRALVLGKDITAVRRGPYRVDERYANAVELRWGVQIPHTSSGTAAENPVNQPAERGDRNFLRGANGIPFAGWEDRKIMDRHFIRRDSNKDVAEAVAKTYLNMWGEEKGFSVTGLDLICPYSCIDVEPGDVVTVTVPNLGLNAKHYLCVEKSLDLDRDELNLTVYDVEMTL